MKHALMAAALVLAAPATAQDRMSNENCSEAMAAIETVVGLPLGGARVLADNEGWCRIDNLSVPVDDRVILRMTTLRWRASGIDRFVDSGLPPTAFELVGSGLGMIHTSGDPVLDYLLALQSSQVDVDFGLTVRWDGVQNAVFVDRAFVDFFADNRIEATARIDGVNLTNQSSMQTSLGVMGVRDLSVTSDFSGWFETYLAMALGSLALTNSDVSPEAQVAALQGQAIEIINEIPDEIMPQPSKTAVTGFVASLPTPRGRAQLQFSADPALGVADLAPFAVISGPPTPQQIVDLGLNGVSLLFTWTPTGDDL